jgi:hypothetical protein
MTLVAEAPLVTGTERPWPVIGVNWLTPEIHNAMLFFKSAWEKFLAAAFRISVPVKAAQLPGPNRTTLLVKKAADRHAKAVIIVWYGLITMQQTSRNFDAEKSCARIAAAGVLRE